MSKYVKIVGIVAVLALVGIIGTAVVLAQDSTPTAVGLGMMRNGGTIGNDGNMMGNGGMMNGATNMMNGVANMMSNTPSGMGMNGILGREEMEAALAEQLGITVEELEAAKEAAREQVIEQAVADGRITQEQADQMLAFQPGLFQEVIDQEAMHAALSQALGITAEELEAALAEGTRVYELAIELGVDMTDVHTAMQTARQEMIDEAVTDGTITQEQADWMSSHQPGQPGQPGQHGQHHGGMGGNWGDQ